MNLEAVREAGTGKFRLNAQHCGIKDLFLRSIRSIDKHFEDHGAEIGAMNLVDYVLKAISYHGQVISDIAKSTESALKAKHTVTDSPRPTSGTKYKNNNDGRFIILANLGQKFYRLEYKA